MMRLLTVSVLGAALITIAGCADTRPNRPAFYVNLAEPGARFDEETARGMINAHRANNGLAPVALDPRLVSLARGYARDIGDAALRNPTVRPDGRLDARLVAAGYDAADVRETVTAGYYTIAEAFSGWRDSPPHDKTMLMENAQHMGIAAIFRPNTKYKVYWVLVMARPE